MNTANLELCLHGRQLGRVANGRTTVEGPREKRCGVRVPLPGLRYFLACNSPNSSMGAWVPGFPHQVHFCGPRLLWLKTDMFPGHVRAGDCQRLLNVVREMCCLDGPGSASAAALSGAST